ncbi:MAG: hypothetical protein ABSH00_08230 [Bryobacteraceae bacterium]
MSLDKETTSTTWTDWFAQCAGPSTAPSLKPPILPWGSGSTPDLTETQSFWIGTQSISRSGSCIGFDTVTFYTDHAAVSGQQTPGIPATICNQ